MTSWHTVMYITCTSWLFYLTSVEKKTSRAPGFRIWVVLSMSLLSIRPKKRKFQWVSSLSFLFLSRIVSNHMLKMCTHAVMCVAYIESSCFFLFQLVHWKCLLNEDFYKWGVLVWYLDPIQWAYLVCSGLIDAAPIFVTLAKLILSWIFCGQVEMCQFPWTLTGIVIHKLEWCYWYYWSLCTVVNVQRYSSMDMSVTWSQPKFFFSHKYKTECRKTHKQHMKVAALKLLWLTLIQTNLIGFFFPTRVILEPSGLLRICKPWRTMSIMH